jgi:hypothetical protein
MFDEIDAIAQERGLPYEKVRDAVLEHPELMGAFSDVAVDVADVIEEATGGALVPSRAGPPAPAEAEPFPWGSVIIPGVGLALVLALAFVKQTPKPRKARR